MGLEERPEAGKSKGPWPAVEGVSGHGKEAIQAQGTHRIGRQLLIDSAATWWQHAHWRKLEKPSSQL